MSVRGQVGMFAWPSLTMMNDELACSRSIIRDDDVLTPPFLFSFMSYFLPIMNL